LMPANSITAFFSPKYKTLNNVSALAKKTDLMLRCYSIKN
jgi:CTP:phosphocholine cytidylyltransferase-like protein